MAGGSDDRSILRSVFFAPVFPLVLVIRFPNSYFLIPSVLILLHIPLLQHSITPIARERLSYK